MPGVSLLRTDDCDSVQVQNVVRQFAKRLKRTAYLLLTIHAPASTACSFPEQPRPSRIERVKSG